MRGAHYSITDSVIIKHHAMLFCCDAHSAGHNVRLRCLWC